jgi:fluoroquinolone transport system permease protein
MKTLALIRGDIRFQYKYGFYLLYLLFSLLYIGLLFAFPAAWREKTAALMILTDPAAMGLFFMGAIVLFEKNERGLDSLAVSPVKPWQYVTSKLVSIGLISTVVSFAIGFAAGLATHPLRLAAGVFLSSCLFSAIGLIVACGSKRSISLCCSRCPQRFLSAFRPSSGCSGRPAGGCACIRRGCDGTLPAAGNDALPLIVLFVWAAGFALLAVLAVKRMLLKLGGMKL